MLIHYRIFIIGLNGGLFDAYLSESIPDDRYFNTLEDAGKYLNSLNYEWKKKMSFINKQTYVILPVYRKEVRG